MNSKIKAAKNVADKVKEAASEYFNFPQIDSDLSVWFTFDGREYELAQFNIRFGQSVDHKGQPQDEIRGGQLILTLTEAVPDTIYQWAMTSCGRDGKVEFRSKTSNAPLKIEFSNGFCVNFSRTIDIHCGITTDIVISSEMVTINEKKLDNHWV